MLIISDFKDYYDSMAYAYGIDKKITFNRKEHKIYLSLGFFNPDIQKTLKYFKLYESRLYKNSYKINIFNFCDNIYYAIEIINKINNEITLTVTNNYNELKELLDNNDITSFHKKHILDIFSISNISSTISRVDDIINSSFSDIDIPYYLIECNNVSITVSLPILRNINFDKILDNNECYQSIEMCINKKYNKEVTVDIEDKYKISQHGFDKHSFKHRK